MPGQLSDVMAKLCCALLIFYRCNARHGGVEVVGWRSGDLGSIFGIPSPRLSPLMARRLKMSLGMLMAVLGVGSPH